jgi:beta-lactamase regulating signal transducer with metallopeptidase domain
MISLEWASFALIYTCATVAAWLTTYVIHSTVILGCIWLLQRARQLSRAQQEAVWKIGLTGGIVTATLALATSRPPLAGRYEIASLIEASWFTVAGSWPLRILPVALVSLWMLYAAAVLLRVIYATTKARRALGPRQQADEATRAMVAAVAARMGLAHKPEVTVSDALSSPVVLGSYELSVPRRVLTDFTPDEQRSIVAHELAHVLRKDPWWLMLAATIESLFFFQVLNRGARRKWQAASEYLCDEIAVQTEGEALPLARSLARIAEWSGEDSPPLLAPSLAEERSTLLLRVRQILEPDRVRPRAPRPVQLLALLTLTILTVGAAPSVVPGPVRGWGAPAFHWSGVVPPGQVLEIQGVMGSIHAVPADGAAATVSATRYGRSTDPDVRFQVVHSESGVTICALYPTPAGRAENHCVPGGAGQFNTKANDVQIEFIVALPAGAGLRASSETGNVTTGPLRGPVAARSGSGNIEVELAAVDWLGSVALVSKSGNITATLPRSADVEVVASTRTGTIDADFPIGAPHASTLSRLKPRGSLGSQARGVLGRGGRQLVLNTTAGNISIHAR